MERPKRRALVVDDNEATRLMVQDLLTREGFLTESARNGAEAIELLDADDRYELIVLDLMMPLVDGYGVLDFLREAGSYPQALRKILIVTASPSLIEEERLLDGLCEVLPKPFTGDHFLACAL